MIGPVASEAATEIHLAVPAIAAMLASGEVQLAATTDRLTTLGGHAVFGRERSVGHSRNATDRVDELGQSIVLTGHDHYPEPVLLVAGTANICTRCLLDYLFEGVGFEPGQDPGGPEVTAICCLAVAVGLASPTAPVCQVQLDDLERALRQIKVSD